MRDAMSDRTKAAVDQALAPYVERGWITQAADGTYRYTEAGREAMAATDGLHPLVKLLARA